MLGDRVLSAPLLSDLIRPDETNIRKEFFSRNLSSEPSDDLGLNWEEQEGEIEVSGDRLKKVGNRARTQSLPTREVSEDEVGQWALPSIPKSIFDKMPHEQTKAGFKQGLTR